MVEQLLAGESGVGAEETLSAEERAREAVMLGLRRTAGIDRATFCTRFDVDLDELAGDLIRPLKCGDVGSELFVVNKDFLKA